MTEPTECANKNTPNVVSGYSLILTISVLSGLLPILLFIFIAWFFSPPEYQQPTLSDYVYTSARPIFYGILFTLGVTLFFYRGYAVNRGPIPLSDNQLASLCGLGALMVALFPTNHCYSTLGPQVNYYGLLYWSYFHLAGAALVYGGMALFLLFYFTQSGELNPSEIPQDKRIRNRLYRICGWTMIGCMILVVTLKIIDKQNGVDACASANQLSYVFWIETVMQFAVAIGWGTKFAGYKISK